MTMPVAIKELIEVDKKENTYITGGLWRKSTSVCGFPTQRASNAESISMTWYPHG